MSSTSRYRLTTALAAQARSASAEDAAMSESTGRT
jgi:hypothetical protein